MDLVSVVIPIYNVEDYLIRCIDSVINQSYSNLEIILVDDGSKDKCGSICDTYAKKDNRIIVIHKTNGGLSDARNAGIHVAKGKYISFIDSDDYVAINYIEELVRVLELTQADMSVVDVQVVNENTPYSVNRIEGDISILSKYDAIIRALKLSFRQSAWGKLYRLDIFDDIEFPKGMLYEDLAIVYQVLYKMNTIALSTAQLYKYEIRSGSIMQTGFKRQQYDSLVVAENAKDFVVGKYPELKKLAYGRCVYAYLAILRKMLLSSNRSEYNNLIEELKIKIDNTSKGLLLCPDIKNSLKIRLFSYRINEKLYLKVEDYLYKKIGKKNG